MAHDAAIAHHEGDHDHPGENFYIKVAIVLTIITVVEVIIYYIEGFRDFLVPALIILSCIKFGAVISYFRHLKFDNKLFAWMFGAGLAISLAVMIAMVVVLHTENYWAPPMLPTS